MSIELDKASEIEKIYAALQKIFQTPVLYPLFPEIPLSILSESGLLKPGYSIYKKGQAYFIVDDNKSQYIETFEDISKLVIVFSFTKTELESPHYGDLVARQVGDTLLDDQEIIDYTRVLEEAMNWDDYSDFNEIISEKLWDLYCYYKDTMLCFLERISLEKIGEYFVVLSTDISFTKSELIEIKKRTRNK